MYRCGVHYCPCCFQSAWVISAIGIVNTVGRILVGWVSDKSWADAVLINTVALVVAGVSSMFVPLYSWYPALIIYSIVFGFSIGEWYPALIIYSIVFGFRIGEWFILLSYLWATKNRLVLNYSSYRDYSPPHIPDWILIYFSNSYIVSP